jgi:diguanylate cyclase (GGDEF)-like protein
MAFDQNLSGDASIKKPRPVLGYMSNGIYGQGGKGGYHINLWKGIQETARANDVKLVCFLGGSFQISSHFEYEYQRNQVFDLISEDNIDGLILSTDALISTYGYSEIVKLCARFSLLPVVSIGIPLEHYPFLSVDNRAGEKAMVDHLIEAHGYRQIAFIRGPENSQDADVRYRAYQDSLAEHGIPLDPNLIVQGDYVRSSGVYAAQRLLDEIKLPLEAVVAANDNMALGFIAALQERGIRVPYDIAVVGFDDIPDAKLSFPSLTTVRQPIYELGQRAVERLLKEIKGVNLSGIEVLPTHLAIRNSCGCALQGQTPPFSLNASPANLQAGRTASRKAWIEEMVDALDCSALQRPEALQQAARLIDALEEVLTSRQTGAKRSNTPSGVMSSIMQNGALLPWHRAISIFTQRWIESGGDQALGATDLATWKGIWQTSSEIAWFSQSFHRLRELYLEETQAEHLRVVSQALVTTFNLSELMETARRTLPKLGIKGCWISLYEEPGDERKQVRLKLAYDQNGRIDLPEEGWVYPVRWLLPKDILGMDRSFDVIVNSLYYGDIIFGLVIFEMDEADQRIIDMVTSQISTALQGAKVVNELQRMQAEFRQQANTDPLTGIYNRRMLYNLAEPAFELARRHNLPLSAIMIDLDNFKRVNDQHGHAVGDHVLRAMSEFVQSKIRGTDIFGRFGGEEFVLILPETTLEGAVFLIERIRKAIEEHPFVIGEIVVPLTISAGVTTLVSGQDQLIDNLIDKADRAVYRAKANGKNCVSI